MTLGKVLEVAIGLTFIFLLLGLVASVVQELFATFVKLRGKYLVQGVSNLLANVDSDCWKAKDHLHVQKIREFAEPEPGQAQIGSPLFLKVMRHPLFRELAPKSMPSYIAPRNFALSLLDVLRDDAALAAELTALAAALPASPERDVLLARMAEPDADLDERLDAAEFGLADLPASPQKVRLVNFLGRAAIKPQRVMRRIEASIRALPPGAAKRALSALLADASGELKSFQAGVETWFDDAMDRVSGVYKRFAQYFTLVFALVAVVAFNVDSLVIARALWNDDSLRASLVGSAGQYVETCLAEPNGATIVGLACPPVSSDSAERPETASEAAAAGPAERTPAEAAADHESAKQRYAATVAGVQEMLDPLALPIGWRHSTWGDAFWRSLPWTIAGWLITALAVSLGAPFWFDLLKHLVNIRGAGPKPRSSAALKTET